MVDSRIRLAAKAPAQRSAPRPQPARGLTNGGSSIVLSAMGVATSAALAGLAIAAAVVLVAWASDTRTEASTGEALRAAVQVWLVAHHGALRLPGAKIGLLPLGLSLFPAVLLLRAGTSLARTLDVTNLFLAIQTTAALAGSYGLFVVIACGLTGTSEVGASPVSTLLGASALAFVAGGAGVVRGSALWRRAFLVLPARVRLLVRACGVGAGVLFAVGTLLAGVALAIHVGRAMDLSHALAPGAISGFVLLLLGIAYVPNAGMWGVAFVAGPGFAVGTGTTVSAFGVSLGPVPAFPMLAALPSGNHVPAPALIALAAPALTGALMGVFVARRFGTGDYGDLTGAAAATWAGLSGVAAGLVLGVAAALSGGPLGPGRLAAVGPSPWQVGMSAGGQLALVAAVVAGVMQWLRRRRLRPQPMPDTPHQPPLSSAQLINAPEEGPTTAASISQASEADADEGPTEENMPSREEG